MKGQIRSRSRGSYTIVVALPRGLDGKRRREVFTVKGMRKVAEAEMARRIHEIETGHVTSATRVTLAQFMERWLDAKKSSALAYSTVERYEDLSRRYIVPALGAVQLNKLSPLQIEEAIGKWRSTTRGGGRKGKIGQRTVHHIYSTLRTALYQAQRWNVITRNPSANVDRVTRGASEIGALDEVAALQLIKALQGDALEIPTLVTVMTGLRRGELLALKWSDIDLQGAVLKVRRSLEIAGDELRFKEPKTPKSRRSIPLPGQVLAALRQHRVRQLETKLQIGPSYNGEDLVFPNPYGFPWNPKRFSSTFNRKLKALKCPVSFHGLRHSYASILLRSGTSLKVASEALGHTNISITADLYTHVLGGLQREAADKLGALFDEASKAAG